MGTFARLAPLDARHGSHRAMPGKRECGRSDWRSKEHAGRMRHIRYAVEIHYRQVHGCRRCQHPLEQRRGLRTGTLAQTAAAGTAVPRVRELVRAQTRVAPAGTVLERARRVTCGARLQYRPMRACCHLAQQGDHCNQPAATCYPPHDPSVPFRSDHGSARAPGFMIRSTGRPPTFFSGKNTL